MSLKIIIKMRNYFKATRVPTVYFKDVSRLYTIFFFIYYYYEFG